MPTTVAISAVSPVAASSTLRRTGPAGSPSIQPRALPPSNPNRIPNPNDRRHNSNGNTHGKSESIPKLVKPAPKPTPSVSVASAAASADVTPKPELPQPSKARHSITAKWPASSKVSAVPAVPADDPPTKPEQPQGSKSKSMPPIPATVASSSPPTPSLDTILSEFSHTLHSVLLPPQQELIVSTVLAYSGPIHAVSPTTTSTPTPTTPTRATTTVAPPKPRNVVDLVRKRRKQRQQAKLCLEEERQKTREILRIKQAAEAAEAEKLKEEAASRARAKEDEALLQILLDMNMNLERKDRGEEEEGEGEKLREEGRGGEGHRGSASGSRKAHRVPKPCSLISEEDQLLVTSLLDKLFAALFFSHVVRVGWDIYKALAANIVADHPEARKQFESLVACQPAQDFFEKPFAPPSRSFLSSKDRRRLTFFNPVVLPQDSNPLGPPLSASSPPAVAFMPDHEHLKTLFFGMPKSQSNQKFLDLFDDGQRERPTLSCHMLRDVLMPYLSRLPLQGQGKEKEKEKQDPKIQVLDEEVNNEVNDDDDDKETLLLGFGFDLDTGIECMCRDLGNLFLRVLCYHQLLMTQSPDHPTSLSALNPTSLSALMILTFHLMNNLRFLKSLWEQCKETLFSFGSIWKAVAIYLDPMWKDETPSTMLRLEHLSNAFIFNLIRYYRAICSPGSPCVRCQLPHQVPLHDVVVNTAAGGDKSHHFCARASIRAVLNDRMFNYAKANLRRSTIITTTTPPTTECPAKDQDPASNPISPTTEPGVVTLAQDRQRTKAIRVTLISHLGAGEKALCAIDVILHYESEIKGHLIEYWGSKGNDLGDVLAPRGIYFDRGEWFIADSDNTRIQTMKHKTLDLGRVIGSRGDEIGSFQHPTKVVANKKLVYVLDTKASNVQVFVRSTSRCIARWNGVLSTSVSALDSASPPTSHLAHPFVPSDVPPALQPLIHPTAMVLDDRCNELYIADSGNHRIVVLSSRNGSWKRYLYGPHSHFSPSGMCLEFADNQLYVCDSYNDHILVLNCKTGEKVTHYGDIGFDPAFGLMGTQNRLSTPRAVVLHGSQVIVADSDHGRLVVFDRNNHQVSRLVFGSLHMSTPCDLFILDRQLTVVDAANHRMLCFE